MEAAKSKRTSAKGRFTLYEKRLKSLLDAEEIDSWTLKNRYEDLKLRWERVQEAHDEYTSHLTEEDDISGAEAWLDELCKRFDIAKIAVGKAITKSDTKLPPKTVADMKEQSTSNIETKSKETIIRMERLRFPTFEGDIKKYPQFREEFMKQIEPQCSKSQLAFVLKSYLSGPVQEEISNVSDNYTKIWDRLDQKYGNISKLVDSILYDVKKLSITEPTDSNVLQMINVVERANRDLERLGEEAGLRNSTSISIIEQAMTKEMRHEWVKLIASKSLSSRQRFTVLLEFLQDWRNRLEYMGASIRKTFGDDSNQMNPTSGKTFHAAPGNTGQSHQQATHLQRKKQLSRCWFHNVEGEEGDHPIWLCKNFLAKNTQERRDLVTSHRACMRCLLTTCAGAKDIAKCGRSFTCPVSGCKKLHNRLLHVDTSGIACHVNESDAASANDAILPTQNL